MAIICHICSFKEWTESKESGEFFPDESKHDRFIKCSYPDKVLKIAQKKFPNHEDRIILMIDVDKLESDIKYKGKGKNKYPEIHGPINTDAVSDVFHLTPLKSQPPE